MNHARADYDDRIIDTEQLIPDDEPVLLVRGQDRAAPATARAWADINERLGGDPEMSRLIRDHAVEIEKYQARTGRSKLADMPLEVMNALVGPVYDALTESAALDGVADSAVALQLRLLAENGYAVTRTTRTLDVVFDGPPDAAGPRFIEVEDQHGASVKLGEWIHRDDGYWALRFDVPGAVA